MCTKRERGTHATDAGRDAHEPAFDERLQARGGALLATQHHALALRPPPRLDARGRAAQEGAFPSLLLVTHPHRYHPDTHTQPRLARTPLCC
jgi:hypothetical protein